jgi:hypothetical protein
MTFIEVEIKGWDKLQSTINRFPVVAEKKMDTAIRRSLERIYREIDAEAPKDTGDMARRWKRIIGRFQGTLQSETNYAVYVNDGTKPHFPPISALKDWSRRHGIPAFLVARKIARMGTKPNPFINRATKNAQAGINKEFKNAVDDILEEMAK